MQQPTLQQQIKQYEANMPPEIMSLIKSFDWRRELRTIVNQNQVMIDVGSDLEESVYLMILGVVSVEDVYERMIEVHEYSEDKTKKILQEIESRIFNPLSKKLQDLDEKEPKESKSIVSQAYNTPNSANSEISNPSPATNETKENTNNIESEVNDSRDSILAEIEKEDPVPETKPSPAFKAPEPMEFSSNGEIKNPQAVHNSPVINEDTQDSGVRKAFSMNNTEEPTPATQYNSPDIEAPAPKSVTGIQEDPITTGFKNPTMMENKKEETNSQASQTPQSSAPRAFDPYREPIE